MSAHPLDLIVRLSADQWRPSVRARYVFIGFQMSFPLDILPLRCYDSKTLEFVGFICWAAQGRGRM